MEELYIKDSANTRGVPIIREQSHKILMQYVKKYNPKHILEIGTAVGYSAIAMLSSCSGDIITIEHNSALAAEATQNLSDAGFKSRAEIICDDCMVQIAQMVADDKYNNYFDFIFLDGPKAQYLGMLEGLVMLLKSGGVLLADNVLFRGYVKNLSAATKRYKTIALRLKKFIDAFMSHTDLTGTELIDIEDGMAFAIKK